MATMADSKARRTRRSFTIPFTVPATRANVEGAATLQPHDWEGVPMTPHHTLAPTTDRTVPGAAQPPTREFPPHGPTLGDLLDAYLEDYAVR